MRISTPAAEVLGVGVLDSGGAETVGVLGARVLDSEGAGQ